MIEQKPQTVNGKDIKVAFQPLHTALSNLDQDMTIGELLAHSATMKLFEAGKGGFSGEDSFVTVDGNKVGRVCAMTGAVFAHDNTDKEASFFYKNGSYMIGAEIVKANARKAWEADKAEREQELEDQMLGGVINPKEWKQLVTAINAETFEFELDADTKAQLIADFDGYANKDEFETAFKDGAVPPFTDYSDKVEALRKN